MASAIVALTNQILYTSLIITIFTSVLFLILLLSLHAVVILRVFNGWSSTLSAMERCNCSRNRQRFSTKELEKIPSYDFTKEKGGFVKDCVVCLENFQEGDKCKILPICGHNFHKECVDYWLLKNAICPICRANVFLM